MKALKSLAAPFPGIIQVFSDSDYDYNASQYHYWEAKNFL